MAESQTAHYLHRRFKDDPEVHVLHGLRIEDQDQPEHDGTVGVCQIDHLIVHRWGMFRNVHRREQVGDRGGVHQARWLGRR